jgi:hypothetical protein
VAGGGRAWHRPRRDRGRARSGAAPARWDRRADPARVRGDALSLAAPRRGGVAARAARPRLWRSAANGSISDWARRFSSPDWPAPHSWRCEGGVRSTEGTGRTANAPASGPSTAMSRALLNDTVLEQVVGMPLVRRTFARHSRRGFARCMDHHREIVEAPAARCPRPVYNTGSLPNSRWGGGAPVSTGAP